MKQVIVSDIDKKHYTLIRDNVSNFIKKLSIDFDKKDIKVLDVAPQVHLGTKQYFSTAAIQTLDIDPLSKADYIADLCKCNNHLISDGYYDLIVCTEVLEHVNNPFDAVNELYRLVKKGGTVAISTPFNFRIHNPLPDNWRFTEHGLKTILSKFSSIQIIGLSDPYRDLMPIHYTTIAVK